MSLRLVTPPAVMPVTLAEAKAHCRKEDSDHDTLLESYIAAATAQVESDASEALITQTWELVIDDFSDTIQLPRKPIQSVESVKYYDADEVLQTVSTDDYAVDQVGDPWLVRATSAAWPTVANGINNVVIRFVAGHADAAEDLPPSVQPLRLAIMLLVGHFWSNREATTAAAMAATPLAYDMLVNPFRPPVI